MSKQLEHKSDGSTANPSKLVCERCKQTYTYQTLGSFGCLGYQPDTNQASELFELCKEVYERFPEWVGTVQFICNNEIFSEGEYEDYGMSFNFDPDKGHTPLYTSDYLLEKLPKELENHFLVVEICNAHNELEWTADYYNHRYSTYSVSYEPSKADITHGDTPLKALLKLTIALSEAGELNGNN